MLELRILYEEINYRNLKKNVPSTAILPCWLQNVQSSLSVSCFKISEMLKWNKAFFETYGIFERTYTFFAAV